MLKDRRNRAFEQINLVQMNLRFLWILSKLLQIRFRVLSIAGNIYWFCLLVLPPGSGALFRGKIINPTDKFYHQDKNNNITKEFWRLTTVRAGFLNFTKTLRWFFSVPMRLKWPSSRTQLSRARGGRAPPPYSISEHWCNGKPEIGWRPFLTKKKKCTYARDCEIMGGHSANLWPETGGPSPIKPDAREAAAAHVHD